MSSEIEVIDTPPPLPQTMDYDFHDLESILFSFACRDILDESAPYSFVIDCHRKVFP